MDGGCTQSNWYSKSKASRVWNDQGHLIFIVAPNSFHLHPYDDVTQVQGEYSFETIYTQGTIGQVVQGMNIQWSNLNELRSPCFDGWTTIQKIPTALIINHG